MWNEYPGYWTSVSKQKSGKFYKGFMSKIFWQALDGLNSSGMTPH
jgi:hypothetical protein